MGGCTPTKSTNFILYPPLIASVTLFDGKQYPRLTDHDPLKSSIASPTALYRPKARIDHKQAEHPVVASSCDRLPPKLRCYGHKETN